MLFVPTGLKHGAETLPAAGRPPAGKSATVLGVRLPARHAATRSEGPETSQEQRADGARHEAEPAPCVSPSATQTLGGAGALAAEAPYGARWHIPGKKPFPKKRGFVSTHGRVLPGRTQQPELCQQLCTLAGGGPILYPDPCAQAACFPEAENSPSREKWKLPRPSLPTGGTIPGSLKRTTRQQDKTHK